MQTQGWMAARVAALAQPDSLRVFAVPGERGVDALAALAESGGWLRDLPLMFEPADLVWRSPEALAALAAQLARQPQPVMLERVPAASPALAALRRAYRGRGLVLVREAMPTPGIDLEGAGQDVDAGLGARRRADLRRAARRAAAFGAIDYELHRPAAGDTLAPLLAAAYGVEARSWKAAAGTALAAAPWQGDFFRRFAESAAAAGMLRIAFLRLGGQVAAMQLALEWQQRFWLLKIGYDPAFAACSPGQLLLRHTLGHAAVSGLRSYEFMGVMDDWTRLWTRQWRRYLHVRAVPFSVAAGHLLARRSARWIWNRLQGHGR
jgi:CelD/BcsL family acetyltransferase involved in cellulose biosynthesis